MPLAPVSARDWLAVRPVCRVVRSLRLPPHALPCAPCPRHKRRRTRPRAADRQQATQRVQTRKETLALAGSTVAYSIPYLEQLPRVAKQLLENFWRHLPHLLNHSLAKTLTRSNQFTISNNPVASRQIKPHSRH